MATVPTTGFMRNMPVEMAKLLQFDEPTAAALIVHAVALCDSPFCMISSVIVGPYLGSQHGISIDDIRSAMDAAAQAARDDIDTACRQALDAPESEGLEIFSPILTAIVDAAEELVIEIAANRAAASSN